MMVGAELIVAVLGATGTSQLLHGASEIAEQTKGSSAETLGTGNSRTGSGGKEATAAEPYGLYLSDPEGLTLEDAFVRSLENAPDILRSRADTAISKNRADSAYVVFLPSAATSASYTRLSEVPDPLIQLDPSQPAVPASSLFPQILDNYGLGLSVQVPLSDYVATLPSLYQLGRGEHVVQVAREEATRERVSMDAALAYFTLLTGRAVATVADHAAAAMASRVEEMSRLRDAGEITRADVMAMRAQAAAVRTQALQARGAAKVGELRLRQLVGWERNGEITLAFDLFAEPSAPEHDLDGSIGVAFAQRAELRALETTLALQDAETSRHFASMFPRLSLNGQLDYANPNQRIFPAASEFRETWAMTIALTWSPNAFLAERTLWKEAELGKVKLQADLQALRDALELEIALALSDWENAVESRKAAVERFESATAAFRARERLFALGETTVQDLLDAEQAARDAALGRITAAAALHLARLRYDRALGQLNRRKEHSGLSPE